MGLVVDGNCKSDLIEREDVPDIDCKFRLEIEIVFNFMDNLVKMLPIDNLINLDSKEIVIGRLRKSCLAIYAFS